MRKRPTPAPAVGAEQRIRYVRARVERMRARGWLWADEPHLLVGWCEELLAEIAKWRPVQIDLETVS